MSCLTKRIATLTRLIAMAAAATAAPCLAQMPSARQPDRAAHEPVALAIFPGSVITVVSAGDPAMDRLLRGLASDSWQERIRAEDELVAYGSRIIPRLGETLAATKDPEVRQRLLSAVSRIEENAVTGPSSISLHLEQVSAAEAFSELAAQADFAIPPGLSDMLTSRATGDISIDVDRVSYWAALSELVNQTGLEPVIEGKDVKFLSATYSPDQPVVVHGPFKITIDQVTRQHSTLLGRPARDPNRSISIRMRIFAEPKLRVLSGLSDGGVDTILDTQGNDLTVGLPRGGNVARSTNGSVFPVNLNVSYDPAATTALARVSGVARMTIVSRFDTSRADLTDTGAQEIRVGSGSLTVLGVSEAGGGHELRLTYTRIPGADTTVLESADFQIVDAEGNTMQRRQTRSNTNGQMTEVVWRLTSPTGAAPRELTCRFPSQTRDVAIPWSFENLRLP